MTAAADAGDSVLHARERGQVPGGRLHRRRPGHGGDGDPQDHRDRRGREDGHPRHAADARTTRRASGPARSSCRSAGTPTSTSTTCSGTTTWTASTAGARAWSASSSWSRRARPTTTRRRATRSTRAPIVDIHTNNPLAPGLVNGSFRELALWTIGDNPITDSTLNLRAEPWSERLAEDPDPSLLFSSWRHGDPRTPLPHRLPQRPVRVPHDQRHRQRHRLAAPRRATASTRSSSSATGTATSRATPQDSRPVRRVREVHRRARGRRRRSRGQRGRLPVHERHRPALPPGRLGPAPGAPGPRPATCSRCPATTVADGPALPQPTGGRPPVVASAGRPCPTGAPARQFAVSAVDLPNTGAGEQGTRAAFVATSRGGRRAGRPHQPRAARAARRGGRVRHRPAHERAGDGAGVLPRRQAGPHGQLVGRQRRLQPRADGRPRATSGRTATTPTRPKIGSAMISDFGDFDSGAQGLYGAFVVAPQGAEFGDPRTGLPRDIGAAGGREAARRRRLPGLQPHAVRQRRRHRGEHDALPDGGRRAGAGELPLRPASRERPHGVLLRRARRPGHADPAGPRRRRHARPRAGGPGLGAAARHVARRPALVGRPEPAGRQHGRGRRGVARGRRRTCTSSAAPAARAA